MFEWFCCCFLIKKNAPSSFRLHLDQFIVVYRYLDSREMGEGNSCGCYCKR